MRTKNDLAKPLNCLNSMSEQRQSGKKLENQAECKYFGLRLEIGKTPSPQQIFLPNAHGRTHK